MTHAVAAIETDLAYRACERITRREAANFFYGIRLLPRAKREAMAAVYAFARRVDDIGDGELEPGPKLSLLASQREIVASLTRGQAPDPADPVAMALRHAHARYALPLDALELLIDGVELDVRATHYDTFDELVVYCRDVAGSIGRLCLAIFTDGRVGGSDAAPILADDLGVAMQLTTILRDVLEDHGRGRTYLPAEDLRRFGCERLPSVAPEQGAALIRFEAARAAEWFARGLQLTELLDGRSAACVLAMTGIYRSILGRIAAEPAIVLRRRISLPIWQKMWLAAVSVARGHTAGGGA